MNSKYLCDISHQNMMDMLLTESSVLQVIVKGDCMAPELNSGDQVMVDRHVSCAVGDIVVFNAAQYGVTVHRVLGRIFTHKGIRIITQSDNGTVPDILLKPNQILGRVVFNQTQGTDVDTRVMIRIKCALNWAKYLSVLIFRKRINRFP